MSGEVAAVEAGVVSSMPAFYNIGTTPEFDSEFESLMPAHAAEERAGLADSIKQEGGCHEPCYAWHDPESDRFAYIDGYARVKICQENSLPLPEVRVIDLPDRAAVRMWIIKQHLNRRNLSPLWQAYFRGLIYNSEKLPNHRPEKLPENQGVNGETAERIAQQLGVSRDTIERNGRFSTAIDQLEADTSSEFKKSVLDCKFKKLTLKDVGELAEKSVEDKKAIVVALESNPKLSLSQAVQSVQPATDTDKASSNATGHHTSIDDPDKDFKAFNSRLRGDWVLLVEIERVTQPKLIDNSRATLIDMLKCLKKIKRNSVVN